MPKERREIDKEVAHLHSILMQTQNNLLLIEKKRAEFIDPESVPPDLQNAEEALRARVIETQKRIEAVKKANEAIDSVDLLTLSVKDDLASIGKEGMKSEQVEVIEGQIGKLTDTYDQIINELRATSLVSGGIEPRLSVLQPNVKLVDANLAYKYADFQEDANLLLGFTTLFLGLSIGELISIGVSIASNPQSVVIAIHSTAAIFGLLITSIFGYLTWRAKRKSDEAKKQIETDVGVKEVLLRSIYPS